MEIRKPIRSKITPLPEPEVIEVEVDATLPFTDYPEDAEDDNPANIEFFSIVNQRNTDPDGKIIDQDLERRMSHPVCLRCQGRYKEKFPGRPFRIQCQGIYSEPDFVEGAKLTGESYEAIREILDIPYWANRHVKMPNSDGDTIPFIARDYQEESLWCTARFQVDRWGRGLGKTTDGVIKELHTATTRKRYNILVACPQKAQAEKWYQEILDIIQRDAGLSSALVQKKQAPYYMFRFANATLLNIFTTGSESGKDASSIRSQSPRRVRIDEEDLLNPGDFKAIMPLLRRYKDSEFHGSSTPLGKRETFWEMCNKYPDYRELHFPITRHPDWTPDMEEACRREARTELTYLHEFLAEFGEQEGGVFKSNYVDIAKQPYLYKDCHYMPTRKYYLGVDWNGQGTGTRYRVVEYDPATDARRCVDLDTVNISVLKSIDKLAELNKKWHCEGIYIDYGFGYVQDELIRLRGANSKDPDDKRLVNVQVIDFGANLTTNKLVPNRERGKYIDANDIERPTKPFMVEGMAMVLEQSHFAFSDQDSVLEDQFRAYRTKTYTKHGWANTYESKVGDHDLDALMLAVLGIEQKYGITRKTTDTYVAKIRYAGGFGGNPQQTARDGQPPPEEKNTRELVQAKTGVPSRQVMQEPRSNSAGVVSRDIYGNTRGFVNTPARSQRQSPYQSVNGSNAAVPGRLRGLGSPARAPSRTGRGLYR